MLLILSHRNHERVMYFPSWDASGDVLQPRVCVNIGEVGYKVKLQSARSQHLWQVMPKEILLSFLILCLQGCILGSVCDWKINHFKTTKEYLERRLTMSAFVCKKNRQERGCGVCRRICMHALIHAPAVPGATIAAQEETDHSGEGKWKHVLEKKGFNFHESSVSRVICVSLSIVPFLLWLYLPPHLSLSVSLT